MKYHNHWLYQKLFFLFFCFSTLKHLTPVRMDDIKDSDLFGKVFRMFAAMNIIMIMLIIAIIMVLGGPEDSVICA